MRATVIRPMSVAEARAAWERGHAEQNREPEPRPLVVEPLTPAQRAYLFGNEKSSALDMIRKRVTTWQEWEIAYAEYLVEVKQRAAQRLQEVELERQRGKRQRRRGAQHSYRDPFTLFVNRPGL